MAPTIVASARSRGCRTLSVPRRRNGSLPRSSRIRRIAKAPPRRGWSCRRLRRVRGHSRRSTVALARLRSNRHARSPCRRLCSEGGGRSHFWAPIGRSETKSNRGFAAWPTDRGLARRSRPQHDPSANNRTLAASLQLKAFIQPHRHRGAPRRATSRQRSRANAIGALRSSSLRKPPRIMRPSESSLAPNAKLFPTLQ
jgi:hypothetical protein